jgi:hypothetical protein
MQFYLATHSGTLQIQYCYFYSYARQKYLYLGLRKGIKIAKRQDKTTRKSAVEERGVVDKIKNRNLN